MGSVARRVLLETAGWLLVVTGIAALVLPGPGLLMMFGGLTVLARHYAWAERWLHPVKQRALQGAAQGVETWPRIVTATVLALGVIGSGALWMWRPPAPAWWPVHDMWWLPGGVAVALTQIASGVIALGLIVYSYLRFRGPRNSVDHFRSEGPLVEDAPA